MTNAHFVSQLIELTDDNLDEHIFELYSESSPPDNLGFVNKRSDEIAITIPDCNIDLTVRQSISQLSSKHTNSTTGYICWNTSVHMVDWLFSPTCPFKLFKSQVLLELGTGVGGICASTLSKQVGHYIATDQKHILKLLKENIITNVSSFQSSTLPSSSENSKVKIDVIEFDWEETEVGCFNLAMLETRQVDVVLACDTIYNEYLVGPFINALQSLLHGDSCALVAIQLRDSITMERFVSELVHADGLRTYVVPLTLLNEGLRRGFHIYYVSKDSKL
ncbi:RKM5 [Candida theae]|uniref:Ribosomal lysine N-methyltransferase 5 n=1 Tax=Candida theae TaxID=1198502 RepID=A0AAD5BBL0_9ASCO|nr:RKM5 [Candida theae]KAI5949979.1 RKM5 [Candida theae]